MIAFGPANRSYQKSNHADDTSTKNADEEKKSESPTAQGNKAESVPGKSASTSRKPEETDAGTVLREGSGASIPFMWPLEGSVELFTLEFEAHLRAGGGSDGDPSAQATVLPTRSSKTCECCTMSWSQSGSHAGLRVRMSNFRTYDPSTKTYTVIKPLNMAIEFYVTRTGEFVELVDASHALAQAFVQLSRNVGLAHQSRSSAHAHFRDEAFSQTKKAMQMFWRSAIELWCTPQGALPDDGRMRVQPSRVLSANPASSLASSCVHVTCSCYEEVTSELLHELDRDISLAFAADTSPVGEAVRSGLMLLEHVVVQRTHAADVVEDNLMPVCVDMTDVRTLTMHQNAKPTGDAPVQVPSLIAYGILSCKRWVVAHLNLDLDSTIAQFSKISEQHLANATARTQAIFAETRAC